MSAVDIIEVIINIGRYCKEQNVDMFIIIIGSQKRFHNKVDAVNANSRNRCEEYGLGFTFSSRQFTSK